MELFMSLWRMSLCRLGPVFPSSAVQTDGSRGRNERRSCALLQRSCVEEMRWRDRTVTTEYWVSTFVKNTLDVSISY